MGNFIAPKGTGFNSRSRGGSDPSRGHKCTSRSVSIHAPAGGATSEEGSRGLSSPLFQFTLPRGERPINSLRQAFQLQFQFTLPRGERH